MGPQLDSCGRQRMIDSARALRRMLQWGRNLIVAEGAIVLVGPQHGALASMGPQLDSCGRQVPADHIHGASSSFNGAAT